MEISLKNIRIKLPYDPAVPQLGLHPEKAIIQKDTVPQCSLQHYLLFAAARPWKQSRYPSTNEWINKLGYICTMEYYSAIKRNEFESAIVRLMNLEPVIQIEVTKRKTNIVY